MTEKIQARDFQLNALSREVYKDAQAHGLYNYPEYGGAAERVRKACIKRIAEELFEAYEAAGDSEHFSEELADVLLVTLSVAGHCMVDMDKAVMEKKQRNEGRSWKHRNEEKDEQHGAVYDRRTQGDGAL